GRCRRGGAAEAVPVDAGSDGQGVAGHDGGRVLVDRRVRVVRGVERGDHGREQDRLGDGFREHAHLRGGRGACGREGQPGGVGQVVRDGGARLAVDRDLRERDDHVRGDREPPVREDPRGGRGHDQGPGHGVDGVGHVQEDPGAGVRPAFADDAARLSGVVRGRVPPVLHARGPHPVPGAAGRGRPLAGDERRLEGDPAGDAPLAFGRGGRDAGQAVGRAGDHGRVGADDLADHVGRGRGQFLGSAGRHRRDLHGLLFAEDDHAGRAVPGRRPEHGHAAGREPGG
ncbi:LOW QUALITY PROTEIN: hypothetical protein BLIG_00894, partial [Bifidobacterium longum subsp. infantis CCUG 52486]